MPKDIDPYDYFAHEDDYPDFDYEGACERLAAALRCKTVYTSADGTDWGEFQKLQDLMRTSFPCVMSVGTFELVGHSVLITIPGNEPGLEAVSSLPIKMLFRSFAAPRANGSTTRSPGRLMMSGCGVAARLTSRTCSWPSSRQPNIFCQRG